MDLLLPVLMRFNIFLTLELLRVYVMSVSLHPVISFSVINYVVSMRCLTRVTRLIFLYHIERRFGLAVVPVMM